jgi:hypothetical protein
MDNRHDAEFPYGPTGTNFVQITLDIIVMGANQPSLKDGKEQRGYAAAQSTVPP